jgi:hypothetical protein
VFGYLPTDSPTASASPIDSSTTELSIVIDGPSPNLTYQYKNGTEKIIGNLTNIDQQPNAQVSRVCRDRAKNCGEMLSMCGNPLYEAALIEMCQLSCRKCGVCVDQSKR